MPSEDFDESADPLTAPAWPIGEDVQSGGFDPGMEERADDSGARAAIPKPPDVGEILRGEYTGWIPVIKAGESLVDAQERAAAKIRRIEAEIEASDIDGAHSVSMWIPYNTGAVPLPPKVTGVPPTTHVTAAVIIPPRLAEPQPPAGEFTRMIPDPDQVLSPSDALDEARRRIQQMRKDLESNVALVTRSFEHEFFAVPPGPDALGDEAIADEPPVSDEVADLIASYTPPAPPPPAPRTPRRTLDDIADEIEKAIDANDARIGEHVVNAGLIREKLRREREAEARAAVARAAAERGPVLPDDVLAALNMSATVDSVNGVPTSGEQEVFDPSLEPLNAGMPARATLDEVFTVPGLEDFGTDPLGDTHVGDLASDVDEEDEELEDAAADVDDDIEDAVIVEVSVTDDVVVIDGPAAPPIVRPNAPPVTGDSEAKFLGDLLDSLADVEAAVTAVVNSTALDDVLAKYKDILEADTSGATREDVEAAAQVSELAAATRVDISAMIEGLKAAAENFSDQDASAGVADAAAALEGIFNAPPVMSTPSPALDGATDDVEADLAAASAPPLAPESVAAEVARMRAAAVAAMKPADEPPPDLGADADVADAASADAAVEAVIESGDDAAGVEDSQAQSLVEPAEETQVQPDEATSLTVETEAAQPEVVEQVAEPTPEPAEPVADEHHLVDLVDSALRRVPLPPIFRGEPKRMSAQEQLDSLGGHVPTMVPPRRLPPKRVAPEQPAAVAPPAESPAPPAPPAAATQAPAPAPAAPASPPPVAGGQAPGGRRSDIDEEHEIDRIIAAAAFRGESDLTDDDEGDDVLTAAEIMGMAPRRPRREPAPPVREHVVEGSGDDDAAAAAHFAAPIADPVVGAAQPAEPAAHQTDDIPAAAPVAPPVELNDALQPPQPAATERTDSVSRRIADESIFNAAAASPVAATYVLNENAAKDHSLELVIMRDEIRDLRDRLDSSQRLIEDLMLRLAQLTEIALRGRMN